MRVRPSLVGEIESRLKREIPKLGNGKELSIVDEVRKNPIVIVDLSSDRRYEDQFLAIRNIVEELSNYAVSRRREGDFALIVVVEEAQYVIPERGFSIVGDPYDSGVAQSLIEAISQAGGYNLGFVIVTQRPAYVSKSVISQANTVVAFRLRNGNDQEAISKYTEVEEVSSYLPTLSDHEALIWGMGSCVPFPVQVEVEVVALPSKSSSSPERAWEKML
ncbi:HerA helicase [Candidatus Korarchaeum cryptofilum OPF8]|uniref:HerA helicase n=2 Tax=Candidatus Korarchaeum cryptofilum TaxID=498846 RepID=B1L4G1_KORCO|nr:HerA helicase [Candidatus Korarchaeum cryptofilum OPF8]